MNSFNWGSNFITGQVEVDQQHQHLVHLINQFGALLVQSDLKIKDVDILYQELVNYSEYHFQEEERLMLEMNVDPRHVDEHISIHHNFLNEIQAIYSTIDIENLHRAHSFLTFLTNWLVYHILGEDKELVKQIDAIKAGYSPSDAYENFKLHKNESTEPLIEALDNLFHLVSLRNKELKELNDSLEDKVALRTQELLKANQKLQVVSLTDSLTGLPNRRHAMHFLQRMWREPSRDLSCIMVDADHFKMVNDNYGHDVGDRVLKEVAATLLHSFRNDDLVCRLGGDEFLVICPQTNHSDALKLAELTRVRMNQLLVETGGEPWIGSISIGVASRLDEMCKHDDLIKLADKGVYEAKKAGKNCVRTTYRKDGAYMVTSSDLI